MGLENLEGMEIFCQECDDWTYIKRAESRGEKVNVEYECRHSRDYRKDVFRLSGYKKHDGNGRVDGNH